MTRRRIFSLQMLALPCGALALAVLGPVASVAPAQTVAVSGAQSVPSFDDYQGRAAALGLDLPVVGRTSPSQACAVRADQGAPDDSSPDKVCFASQQDAVSYIAGTPASADGPSISLSGFVRPLGIGGTATCLNSTTGCTGYSLGTSYYQSGSTVTNQDDYFTGVHTYYNCTHAYVNNDYYHNYSDTFNTYYTDQNYQPYLNCGFAGFYPSATQGGSGATSLKAPNTGGPLSGGPYNSISWSNH